MVHAQQPTCVNIRIRSTQDTHKVFYAIQNGHLKMVTRRLDADERLALCSGCVYAWEERGPHSEITGLGIERFTEGRRWTPSRVRDEFLFYYERYMPAPDVSSDSTGTEAKPPRDWEPMVKQTYSVWVDTENGRRKWHLTAYFTQGTIDKLGTVDDLPNVGTLVVPEGIFKSTRVGKGRSKHGEDGRLESTKSSAVTRTYAPFPSPYPTKPANNENAGSSSQPVLMYSPYQNESHSGYYHSQTQQPSETMQGDSHSRGSSQSRSPQDHSPISLSPNVPSPRPQYSSDRSQFPHANSSPLFSGDVPGASGHEGVSHPSEYRTHIPPQSGVGLNTYGQRENFVSQPWNIGNSIPDPAYAYQPSNGHLQHPNVNNTGVPPSGYSFPMTQDNNHMSTSTALSAYQQLPSPDGGHVTGSYAGRIGTLPSLHIPSDDISPYELAAPTHVAPVQPSDLRNSSPRPYRALAPLCALNRQHPYRREQIDDKALRLLQNAGTPAI